MNLREEIFRFTKDSVYTRIQTDISGFVQDLESFSKRKFTLTDAKINLDRKTLHVWKKQGLLPYEQLAEEIGKQKVWQKFSFIELCWLQLIIELRNVGVGLDHITTLKSFFFPADIVEQIFKDQLNDLDNLPADAKIVLENNGMLQNDRIIVTENLKTIFAPLQLSYFSFLLYVTILDRANYVLCISGNNQYRLIDINFANYDPIKLKFALQDLLNNDTVVFVNIRKIITDLTNTHDYFSTELKFNMKFTKASKEALQKLFADEKILEIAFRSGDNKDPLAFITKKLNEADFKKEIQKITKKGNYGDLVVKTRNGNIQYFKYTEIIKFS